MKIPGGVQIFVAVNQPTWLWTAHFITNSLGPRFIIVDLSAKQSTIAPGHIIQEFESKKIVSRDQVTWISVNQVLRVAKLVQWRTRCYLAHVGLSLARAYCKHISDDNGSHLSRARSLTVIPLLAKLQILIYIEGNLSRAIELLPEVRKPRAGDQGSRAGVICQLSYRDIKG